ncbi:hypothetical protein N9W23_01960 [Paracoccaceae bacterium]|nr:hypothetical protein [Paracoccaceae bacterium]MDB2417386.1 hypothetical protein [Paracoccaceae bacterium]MDC0868697.1 hypothetical protein [Paracoccaceae bacterium]
MRQFKLWFCSLLLLIANVANSQTSDSTTPDVEELTDGIRAFTCEDGGREMPLIFVQEDSKWRLVGIEEADLITEINDGFMIRYSGLPGELSFLQEAQATFQYQYLSSNGYYEAECKEQDDFLELVVEVISSKVVENATTLSQTVGKLENKLRKLEDIQDTLNEARETNRKNFIRFNIEKEALTSKYESELSLQTEKLLLLNSRLTKAGNTAGNLLINQLNADKKTQEAIFNTSLNADNKVREQLVEKFDLYNAKLGPYCVNRFLFKPTEIDEECRTGIIQLIFN